MSNHIPLPEDFSGKVLSTDDEMTILRRAIRRRLNEHLGPLSSLEGVRIASLPAFHFPNVVVSLFVNHEGTIGSWVIRVDRQGDPFVQCKSLLVVEWHWEEGRAKELEIDPSNDEDGEWLTWLEVAFQCLTPLVELLKRQHRIAATLREQLLKEGLPR